MKKIFISALIVLVSLLALSPALANENRSDKAEKAKAKLVQVNKKYVSRAVTVVGKLVQVNSTTTLVLNVTNVLPNKSKHWVGAYPEVNKQITVKLTEKTKLYRQYWGKAILSEMVAGDTIRVVGKTNEDGTLTALAVKDNSIHTLGLNKGTVQSIDVANKTLVVKQKDRILTVKLNDKTKLLVKGVEKPTLSDVKVGDTAQVKGIINLNTKTVDANYVRTVTPATSTVR